MKSKNIVIILWAVFLCFPTFAFSSDFQKLWQNQGGTVKKQNNENPQSTTTQNEQESQRTLQFSEINFSGGLLPLWSNYREHFNQRFIVCHNKRATLQVDLPASIISGNENLILVVDLESRVFTVTDGLKEKNFQLIHPYISINGAMFLGRYNIPVKKREDRQICKLKIKRKHLKKGRNTLEFIVGREGDVRWMGKDVCYGFYVHNIYFENYINPVIK